MKYWYQIALVVTIGVGVTLRLWWFYDARSLFLDEANLALNIAELTCAELFHPLKYQQYAPPLFVCLVKGSTDLFGLNEWALRLPALAFGLLSLWLFYRLLTHLITNKYARLLPLLLFATSGFLIRYSAELKQYSLDVAIVLLFVLMAIRWPLNRLNRNHWGLWATAGIIAIWLSMPVVFVLFSIGAYYAWQILQEKRFRKLLPLVLVAVSWLLSFALLYDQVLSPSLGESHLINHHTPYFFPTNLFILDAWAQIWMIVRGLIAPVIGYTALALILGAVFLIWGGYRYFKHKTSYFILLALPIFSCFVASALGQFSLMPRVSLFMMPLFLLFLGKGVEALQIQLPNKWQIGIFVILLLITEPVWQSVYKVGQSTEIEDIRTAIRWAKSKSVKTFVHNEAVPAYRFYSEYHDDKSEYRLDAVLIPWSQSLPETLEAHPSSSFTVLHSHILSDFARSYTQQWVSEAQAVAKLKDKVAPKGAAAHYFEIE